MFDSNYLSVIEERVLNEAVALKEEGSKVVGVYCAFTPRELIAACGAIPVSLCAGSDRPIAVAEQHLPRNLCPLIKASYGHALADTCPYFHETDFLLADATCDGKKKMFELLRRVRPLHLLQLPQTAETDEGLQYWLHELQKARLLLEERTGNAITDASLSRQIEIYNELRSTLKSVFELNTGDVPLLYGREIECITDPAGFECNLEKRIAEMKEAVHEVKARALDSRFVEEMRRKPRIMITGCPTTNKKLLDIIEDAGGVAAAMENCGGLKSVGSPVREDMDPMLALAEKYLSIPCACMTPNHERLQLIRRIIQDYKIDGVVELTWQACHTYNVESYLVQEFVTGACGKSYLQIETDYSENDTERIRVRVEAFLELLG